MAIETTIGNDNFLHPLYSLNMDFNSDDINRQYLAMHSDPYSLFLGVIKSPETREKL